MADFLSPLETAIAQPGAVLVNVGQDVWRTWANASTLTGAQIGILVITGRPGTAIQVHTLGRFPYVAFNLGAGNPAPVQAGNVPSRSPTGTGQIIGTCDASGEIFMLPSVVGTTSLVVAVTSVANVAALRATLPSVSNTAVLDGYNSIGDGGGGTFVWNATDTRSDDSGTVFQVSGTTTGRWNRVLDGSTLNVRWFGAVGNGQRVSDAAITSGLSAVTSATAVFTQADVGKLCCFYGAGAAGVTLAATITGVNTSTNTATISTPASTSVLSGGIFRWGTDDHTPIVNALNAAVALGPLGLWSTMSTVYFPPGEYAVSTTITFDATYAGVHLAGASGGKAGPVPLPTSKITLLGSGVPLLLNRSQSNTFKNLWFDGARLATRVVDFEAGPSASVGANHQSWYDCAFDSPAQSGYVHYYGQDDGQGEVDVLKFWGCYLVGDIFDATYRCAAVIWNNNSQAFLNDYYGGTMTGATYIMQYQNGSCSLHGVQVGRFASAMLHIFGTCKTMELEDVYLDAGGGGGGNFVETVDSGSGLSADDIVTMRRCHDYGGLPIVWGHSQTLVLEDCETAGLVTSQPSAFTAAGQGPKRIFVRNLRFVNPNLGFVFNGLYPPYQLVEGDYYNNNNGTNSVVTDGAITLNTNSLTSPGNGFLASHQGLRVSVPGAGPSGAAFQTYIKQYVSAGQVLLSANASTTVSAQTVTYTGTPITVTQLVAPSGVVQNGPSVYDYNGFQLGVGSYVVPASPLSGTASVSGTAVTFSANQTLVAGTQLVFTNSNQTTTAYVVASTTSNSPSATLTVSYSGSPTSGLNVTASNVFIIPGDMHWVTGLTNNRATTISAQGVQPGMVMLVSRVGATDAFTYSVTFNQSNPQTIALSANQWAKFVFVNNAGWIMMESGSAYPTQAAPPIQTGTLTLVTGTKTINTGITMTANSVVYLSRLATGGTITSTVQYTATSNNFTVGGPGTGAFIAIAAASNGTVASSDTSTLGYMIVG